MYELKISLLRYKYSEMILKKVKIIFFLRIYCCLYDKKKEKIINKLKKKQSNRRKHCIYNKRNKKLVVLQ
jgi:hypothetical protein